MRAQNPKLVSLGTNWALTRFEALYHCNIRTYENWSQSRREKEACGG